jgi:putative membrane protein
MSFNDAILTAHDGWDGPGAWWPIFPILWLLLIGTVVFLVVRFGRRNWRMAGTRAGEARLAELFAAGEITEEEYRHRLGILKEQQP